MQVSPVFCSNNTNFTHTLKAISGALNSEVTSLSPLSVSNLVNVVSNLTIFASVISANLSRRIF